MRTDAIRGNFPLQRGHVRAEYKLAALQHPIDGLCDLIAQGVVLDFQVQDWDHER